MHQDGDLVEAFRKADQRLRLMLLGDGVSESGLVKGEEARARAATALRQMRELFTRAVEEEGERAAAAEARSVQLEEELLHLASLTARADDGRIDADRLLTPTVHKSPE